MGFFKRYPIFCIVLVLLALVLGAGVYLVVTERARVEQAKSDYVRQLRQLEEVSRGVPYSDETNERVAPIAENREVLENRLEKVRADLARIREGMMARSDRILGDSADEFTFLPKLQSFIARNKALAANNQIKLEEEEAFGFARYATRAAQPAEEMIPLLNLQRQILDYILNELINSRPSAILAVERELVEAPAADERGRPITRDNRGSDVFTIAELVTAGSNEFIRTSAFRVVFTGQTDVLRNFLNRLASFELPLVVRSVEVQPASPEDEPETAASPREEEPDDALATLFGRNDEPEPEEPEASEEAPVGDPVITENNSKFTVVIEYVELEIDSEENGEEAGS